MPIGVAGGIALAGTAASAGLGAAGSAGQKEAASQAADAESAGIGKGIDALTKSYERAQGYQDPYYRQGQQVNRRLAQQYGIIPEGLTAKERKAYKKSPRYNQYQKSLRQIDASAPGRELTTIGPNGQMYNPEALPDLSRFDVSGLAGKYGTGLRGVNQKYDVAPITQKFSALDREYDPSAILRQYDVSNLGDRVNVEQDPGYKFRKQQGEEAQKRMASARGTLQGGGFAKDLEEFSQGLASQEYGNAYARLLGENETGFGRAYDANQRGYSRALDTYGRELEGNQIGYGREFDENQLGYSRELEGNQIGYGRALGENEIAYGRGQDRYNRGQEDYARQLQMLGLEYEPYQRYEDRGFQAAGNLSDLATGYGGNIANLFSQQGQAQAGGITGRAAANAQLFNNLGQIGLIGGLYGAQGGGFGGGGSSRRNSFAGGYNPYAQAAGIGGY